MTPGCNMACRFCYNVWRGREGDAPKELSLEGISRLADSLEGISGITFTGGEPLLRDDLQEIVRIFSSRGVTTALATNGILLDRATAFELAANGIDHFDIGITVPSKESALAVSFAAATGRTVTASLCLHRGNYLRTGVRVRTAAALGADSVCLNRFVPTGRGALASDSLMPTLEQLETALLQASEAAERCPVHLYCGIPVPELSGLPRIDFPGCGCGLQKWAVDPAGNLRACEQNSESLGNLLENSFSDLTGSSAAAISAFRTRTESGCAFLPRS